MDVLFSEFVSLLTREEFFLFFNMAEKNLNPQFCFDLFHPLTSDIGPENA